MMRQSWPQPCKKAVAIAVTFAFASAGAQAQEDKAQAEAAAEASQGLLPIPDYKGTILERSFLTGDWNGTRTDWANHGVQLGLETLSWGGSVVDGGIRDDDEYGTNITYKMKFDLMRAGILPGALIDIRAESRFGDNINPNAGTAVPNFTASLVPVDYDNLDKSAEFAVTNLTYTQFLAEWFGVFLGKVDTFENGDLNEFASGRGRTQFFNYNLNYGPQTLIVPASTPAIGAIFLPNKNLTISSSLLSATDCSYAFAGCFDDFSDQGRIWANAATLQYRLADLPGGFNLNGLYFYDQDFRELGSLAINPGDGTAGAVSSTDDESWLGVISGWQYVYAKDTGAGPLDLANKRPDLEGIGVFSRVGFADEDTNPFKLSISGGIGGRGLIPTRTNDVYGLGYFYNDVNSNRFTDEALGTENHTQGVEVFYNLAITPAAKLTADFQWLQPAVQDVDDAYVLSGRLHFVF